MKRRLPKLCALCGLPAVDGLHCVAHTWASPPVRGKRNGNGNGSLGRYHAYWIERLTPAQVDELAAYVEAST